MSLTPRLPIFYAALLGGVALCTQPAQAQQEATLNVSAEVPEICSFDTLQGDLVFGEYDGTTLVESLPTTFEISCSANTTVAVALNEGDNANGVFRRMKHEVQDLHLSYTLFKQDQTGKELWASNNEKEFNAAAGTPVEIGISGEIQANQTIGAQGMYTDRVILTLRLVPGIS